MVSSLYVGKCGQIKFTLDKIHYRTPRGTQPSVNETVYFEVLMKNVKIVSVCLSLCGNEKVVNRLFLDNKDQKLKTKLGSQTKIRSTYRKLSSRVDSIRYSQC